MTELKHPDPKLHLLVSVLKSGVRIIACIGAATYGSAIILAVGFGIAEVIGIFEELV